MQSLLRVHQAHYNWRMPKSHDRVGSFYLFIMKQLINQIRFLAFMLGFTMMGVNANAQFVNGDFAAPGTAGCSGGTGWTTNPSPNYAQYVTSYNPNPWIDLTPCHTSGNGTWVQQTINTTPGALYFIRMDLGTWYYWGFDAGVDLSINGTQLGSRIAHSDPAPMGSPGWRRMSSCIFRATGPTTVVRITGDAQYIANPSNPVGIPGVIGLDNVQLYRLNNYLMIGDDDIYCNIHCLQVIDTLTQDTLGHSLGNFQWYVQGVLEGTGTTFCRKYPYNVSRTVMVTFDVTDACGMHHDTLWHNITPQYNCPCDIANGASLLGSQINCNSFHYDLQLFPGYVATNTQWTVDGSPVAGTTTSANIMSLSPGTHTICATVTGHVEGEPNNSCTGTVCTTVTVSYIYSSAPDVYLWTCGSTPASFTPGCGYPYTSFRLTGTNNYSVSGTLPVSPLNLPLGTYVLECYDYNNCQVLQTNVYVNEVPYVAHTCDVYLTNCSQLNDLSASGPIMTQVGNNCPDCATALMNISSMGQWEHVSYDENTGELVVKREYVSTSTCRSCIVTFHISGQFVPRTDIHAMGAPCTTLGNADLIPCLQNKPLKFYLSGHADQAIDVDPNVGFQICCENENGVQNPTYYVYDPDNPCCMMRLFYICVEFKTTPDDGPLGVNNANSDNGTAALSIQPNPTAAIFHIVSGREEKYERVDIVDMSGRVLMTKKNADVNTVFDISSFREGSYLVKVRMENDIIVLKLEHMRK